MLRQFTQRLGVAAAALTFALVLAPFSAEAGSKVVKSGEFTGASDHITTGGVSIIETTSGALVVLENSFSLDGAPDPKVGFGKSGTYDEKSKVAHLENIKGLQVYAIPASVNVADYNEVYIWCEKFSVPLGVAALK